MEADDTRLLRLRMILFVQFSLISWESLFIFHYQSSTDQYRRLPHASSSIPTIWEHVSHRREIEGEEKRIQYRTRADTFSNHGSGLGICKDQSLLSQSVDLDVCSPHRRQPSEQNRT